MDAVKKISVFTGARAEYGLLLWVLKGLQEDPAFELQLIVTGTHMDRRYGKTIDAILADGFEPVAAFELPLDDAAVSMGQCLSETAKHLENLKPDVLVLLGDRYETLAAACAAVLNRVPVVHIHGGEITEGAMDDSFRNAVSKMADLHFPATEMFAERLIAMGEDPARVIVSGAPGIDSIDRLDLLAREELGAELAMDFSDGYFVVTFHPATAGEEDAAAATDALVSALEQTGPRKVLLTGVNADPGRDPVARRFQVFAEENPGRVGLYESLGQLRYLSALKHADAVIGNSSSAIIEAPALETPSINIGMRQQGRPRADSIIDCASDAAVILNAIETALSPAHAERTRTGAKPYGGPGASDRILKVLKQADAGLVANSNK